MIEHQEASKQADISPIFAVKMRDNKGAVLVELVRDVRGALYKFIATNVN
jgi:hypothetical protein